MRAGNASTLRFNRIFRYGLSAAGLLLGLLALDACSPSAAPGGSDALVSTRPPDAASAPIPDKWAAWIDGLSAAGYDVKQGGLYILDSTGCQLYLEIFKTCAGNNPVAPYLVMQPPVAGEYVDPNYATAFGTTTSTGTPINEFYRLGDNEALVVLVDMPPRAAYLGYQSYDYTRDIGNYPSGTSNLGTAPDSSRVITFGSLGNATNNVVIQRQSGVDWGGGVVGMITTSNQTLDSALRAVFKNSTTMNSNLLFSEPIGNNVTTGIGKKADELFTLMRYALPENLDAGNAWANTPGDHVWVFRVTDNSGASVSRYGAPSYTRKTATIETTLASDQQELASLLQGYVTSVQGFPATTTSMYTTVYYNAAGDLTLQVGSYCIANGLNCAGDDQDTDAYRLSNVGTLSDTHTAFVVGIDHTQYPAAVGANATYVSVGVYDGTSLTGVDGVSQTNQAAAGFTAGTLTGSAKQALQDLGLYNQASAALKASLQYFYVAAFARQCVVSSSWCLPVSTSEIPGSHPIILSQRAYMRPGTTTGGNPNVMLTPLVVRPGSGS